jgi:hypothetical protein
MIMRIGTYRDVGGWQRPLRAPAIDGLPLEGPRHSIPDGSAQ